MGTWFEAVVVMATLTVLNKRLFFYFTFYQTSSSSSKIMSIDLAIGLHSLKANASQQRNLRLEIYCR